MDSRNVLKSLMIFVLVSVLIQSSSAGSISKWKDLFKCKHKVRESCKYLSKFCASSLLDTPSKRSTSFENDAFSDNDDADSANYFDDGALSYDDDVETNYDDDSFSDYPRETSESSYFDNIRLPGADAGQEEPEENLFDIILVKETPEEPISDRIRMKRDASGFQRRARGKQVLQKRLFLTCKHCAEFCWV